MLPAKDPLPENPSAGLAGRRQNSLTLDIRGCAIPWSTRSHSRPGDADLQSALSADAAAPSIPPTDPLRSETRIPSGRSRPPLHPGSPLAPTAGTVAPTPSLGVFVGSPMGTSSSVFGRELRTPGVACFRQSSKRSWEIFPAGSPRVAGTTPGGLCLTPAPREIVDSGTSHGLEFFENPDFSRFPPVGAPQTIRGRMWQRPSPDPVLD